MKSTLNTWLMDVVVRRFACGYGVFRDIVPYVGKQRAVGH